MKEKWEALVDWLDNAREDPTKTNLFAAGCGVLIGLMLGAL